MSTYSSVHFDGELSAAHLQRGVIETPGHPTPVVSFQVVAGLQAHPVWALDRLAIVVSCYCQAARQLKGSETGEFLQVNVQGTLVSNEHTSITVASSIHWHTSKAIRDLAERMIAGQLQECNTPLGCRGTPKGWPQDKLVMPVSQGEVASRSRRKQFHR